MSEEIKEFFKTYAEFVTKVTSEPSLDLEALNESFKEIENKSNIKTPRLLTAALINSVKIVKKNGVKVIGIMPADTPLSDVCDFPLTINIGVNNRISMPLTSRIAYTAVIDVLTMGVAQLKPEAQDHLYNIADSQRSLKIDN